MAKQISPKCNCEGCKNQNNHGVVYVRVLNVFATTILMIAVSYRAEPLLNSPIRSLCAEGLAAGILPQAVQESQWFILKKWNE